MNTDRKKALVVAVDDYHGMPLRGCINDAQRIAEILMGPTCGFALKMLVNHEVTRTNTRSALHWLFEDTDTSLFFFAGHGLKRKVTTYLVTHDYQEFDEGIDLSWLAQAANKLAEPSQSVLYILDCCHSGDAAVRSMPDALVPVGASDLPPISGSGRTLIAACKGTELAYEYNHNGVTHGAFTHHLCSALEGAAANDMGDVTVNSAFDFVASNLRSEGRQTPVMRGDQEGAMLLARNVKKSGTWSPNQNAKISITDAVSKADELLCSAHAATQGHSFDQWQTTGFSSACRAFEPILSWFRRRTETQPELLRDKEFQQRYNSCQHIYKSLCSLTPGIEMATGTLKEPIGSGSFGTVWTMSASKWNLPVCFKAYHPHDLLDPQKNSRFRRGYDAMRQLDHPRIVKVLDLIEVPFGFYMEFVEGANIRQLNPGASLEPASTVQLLLDVAETLKHAHGRGVIHRDVKPENILVKISDEGDYEAYLTDFDLAWFSAATQVTKVADGFGSHFYAAPEQINSPQAGIAHRTSVDSYSFGQLCFFCVCGRDPMAFDQESNTRALADELGRKWNDSTASQEMLTLFAECTKRSPDNRIQDFRDISERLARLLVLLTSKDKEYEPSIFLEQLRFNLGGGLNQKPSDGNSVSLRSRSGRTDLSISVVKDATTVCALDVTVWPNEIVMEGRKSSDVRFTINQRIDAMLQNYKDSHDATRKGAKMGAYEITIRIDRLTKNSSGVLEARAIISRVLDIIEQT